MCIYLVVKIKITAINNSHLHKSQTADDKSVVPVTIDSAGHVKTDAILGHSADKKVFSQYTDLIERQPGADDLVKPSEEDISEATARTRAALEKIVNSKPLPPLPLPLPLAAI